jgi:manganese transport protein
MGTFANKMWVKLLAWTAAVIIVGLNIRLVYSTLSEWIAGAGDWSWLLSITVVPLAFGLGLLLAWVTFHPVLPSWLTRIGRAPISLPEPIVTDRPVPAYRKILVPLDHTERDREALAHAVALARQHNAKLYLLHVEEGVTSQVYGPLSSTAEVEAGSQYLNEIADSLRRQNIDVETIVTHSNNPTNEIVKSARQIEPDLIIMGAHGHRGIKDLVYGATINSVRHELDFPLLIVRRPN